jgi:probable H4MPT-linked C1 transfer pathway protein
MTITAGLDVGGAHLKVALVEEGRTVGARQFVCPLWLGLDKLDAALEEARALTGRATRHGVTMTGELSDLFPDRKTGVETLVDRLERAFGPATKFWMGVKGFGDATSARRHYMDVGSTNFLATAALAARRLAEALLVDFGSTTADIVPIAGGKPVPRGLTDAERLATGELVYTGLTRTAVMGVATRAPFKGRIQTLAREYLTTMADVRRILGELPDGVDQHSAADGRGKSLEESVARFARMFGRDGLDGGLDDWRASAAFVREEQMRSILDGCLEVLGATSLPETAPLVLAGIGAQAASEIASRLGRPSIAFGEIANADAPCRLWATYCAPAVAVALLADGEKH